MNDPIEQPVRSSAALSTKLMWFAVVVSLLIHIAVLWQWHSPLDRKKGGEEDAQKRLTVQLMPAARPAPAPAPAPALVPTPPSPPRQAQRAVPRKAAPKPPAAPKAPAVLALKRPAPQSSIAPTTPALIAPPVPAPAPAPSRAPAEGDMSAAIDARRRARANLAAAAPQNLEPQPQAVEDETAKRLRIQRENMGLAPAQARVFGYDPSKSGGVFQIERIGYDAAEFLFFGWNKDIKRNTMQHIEVRKGNNPDIRIAVVRKMIAIIREYEPAEFSWDSAKLRKSITLSARQSDNAGLEDFMLWEFFDVPRKP